MPQPLTRDAARSHGEARRLSAAAVTASRHLSKIFVTVRPLGPSNAPSLPASCRSWPPAARHFGMAQGLGRNMARDMPACCLVACGALAWARPARQCGRDTRHQPCSPAAIGESDYRNARPDILDLSGECSRPYAAARTPGRAYDIMLSKAESLSAGEGARHVAPYQDIRADLPDKQWFGVGLSLMSVW
jgi:hypothetical protein